MGPALFEVASADPATEVVAGQGNHDAAGRGAADEVMV
jgi:hypothetical protein